jgi:capsular exopolysaccharide synthesis family protein
MTTFTRVLEQAEHDRALREPGAPRVPGAAPASQRPPAAAATGEASAEGIDGHLVSLLAPDSFAAEQFRMLAHAVAERGKGVVAVSSPAVGEGKTVTAINLAGALAQAPGARVLLVDADLRRPSVAPYLGLDHSTSRGLVDAVLDPGLSLVDIVAGCPSFNLEVVPAGRPVPVPYKLLSSTRLDQLLDDARRQYDHVVLDLPPVVGLPDCRVISRCLDGLLLVVAAHKTSRPLLTEALRALESTKVIGLAFNGDDGLHDGYSDHYHRSPGTRGATADRGGRRRGFRFWSR